MDGKFRGLLIIWMSDWRPNLRVIQLPVRPLIYLRQSGFIKPFIKNSKVVEVSGNHYFRCDIKWACNACLFWRLCFIVMLRALGFHVPVEFSSVNDWSYFVYPFLLWNATQIVIKMQKCWKVCWFRAWLLHKRAQIPPPLICNLYCATNNPSKKKKVRIW